MLRTISYSEYATMGLSLKPEHLKRYKDIARLFLKYGRSDLVKNSELEDLLSEEEESTTAEHDPKAEELADDLEKMGPIFIKLGQLLSTRADIMPVPYLKALARLQDDLEPFSYEEVEEIVQTELGVRISKGFSRFDREPIAAASLGQVHRAALRDGREVAVKIQRPHIRKEIAEDLEALQEIAEFMADHTEAGRRYRVVDILDEFRANLVRELDYRQEARNLTQLRENLERFRLIVVPMPVDDYTTSRVLTMEYIAGKKITALGPLAHLEMNGARLAEELFRAYLQQILVDGVFHADPHPGNVFLTDDKKIALIDLGMVGRISPGLQEQLLRMLMAISEGRSDEAATIAMHLGERSDEFDEHDFRKRTAAIVARQQDATVGDIEIGKLVIEVSRISADNGLRLPAEFTMLGKTLLNLDEVARTLDPEFDPNESIRRNSADIFRKRTVKEVSPANVFSSMMEMKEFIEHLPGKINRILDAISRNELQIKVDAIDEKTLMHGFEKVANRITVGLIVAALIVGAAMLMRVETTFRVFGYPGLAILCFLAAAGIGFWLVISVLVNDSRRIQNSK
jgi:predicted unusual protein kinase regulating ubiquinone biosynthesis (AarF/ABC1/UbiB family)